MEADNKVTRVLDRGMERFMGTARPKEARSFFHPEESGPEERNE